MSCEHCADALEAIARAEAQGYLRGLRTSRAKSAELAAVASGEVSSKARCCACGLLHDCVESAEEDAREELWHAELEKVQVELVSAWAEVADCHRAIGELMALVPKGKKEKQ
jgi:hypothetical protein